MADKIKTLESALETKLAESLQEKLLLEQRIKQTLMAKDSVY